MSDSLLADTVHLVGQGSETVEAYHSHPLAPDQRGGVVVIHHFPGYDRATKEIVRRIAELGYDAICPNLFYREAPGASPDDAAAISRAQGGVPDDRLIGDARGAIEFLRSLPTANGKVATIGFCSGGRQSVLCACTLQIDAAIDCYGAYVVGDPSDTHPIRSNLSAFLPKIHAPLLGLFGSDDKAPSPDHVAELDRILTEGNHPHEFITYPNAGHAFFATDRVSYRVAAANEGWEAISAFLAKHLS